MISIVTTMYQTSEFVKEFYERISIEVQKITNEYEIIFVDDGSQDESLSKVMGFCENDKSIKIVELSRNYGHHTAIMAGLSQSAGDYVFLIDCDLEEPPELLNRFWQELHKEKDIDVVYGVQVSRKGKRFERWSGNLFWKIFNVLSFTKISQNPLTIRLMKKKFVEAATNFKEKELFLAGVFELVGFNQKKIEIQKLSNNISNYSFLKKIKLFNNAIVSFSSFPLMLSFYMGTLISFCSFFYGISIILNKIFLGSIASGWTSLMVSIWFLCGVILFSIGIIGIYLSKIYTEVKNRPVVIKRIYGGIHSNE